MFTGTLFPWDGPIQTNTQLSPLVAQNQGNWRFPRAAERNDLHPYWVLTSTNNSGTSALAEAKDEVWSQPIIYIILNLIPLSTGSQWSVSFIYYEWIVDRIMLLMDYYYYYYNCYYWHSSIIRSCQLTKINHWRWKVESEGFAWYVPPLFGTQKPWKMDERMNQLTNRLKGWLNNGWMDGCVNAWREGQKDK